MGKFVRNVTSDENSIKLIQFKISLIIMQVDLNSDNYAIHFKNSSRDSITVQTPALRPFLLQYLFSKMKISLIVF